MPALKLDSIMSTYNVDGTKVLYELAFTDSVYLYLTSKQLRKVIQLAEEILEAEEGTR